MSNEPSYEEYVERYVYDLIQDSLLGEILR
mgnify:FL=1